MLSLSETLDVEKVRNPIHSVVTPCWFVDGLLYSKVSIPFGGDDETQKVKDPQGEFRDDREKLGFFLNML